MTVEQILVRMKEIIIEGATLHANGGDFVEAEETLAAEWRQLLAQLKALR